MPQKNHIITQDQRIHAALSQMIVEAPLYLKISGNCMHPLIKDGASIQFQSCPTYYPGDILLFQSAPGVYSVHRLLGAYKRNGAMHFITRGDNSSKADTSFSPERCLGKVYGGDCEHPAIHIPLHTRFFSLIKFSRIVALVLLRKINLT